MTAGMVTEPRNGAEVKRGPDDPARVPQERRRPGRAEHVSPALIGMLRSQPGADVLDGEDRAARNALGAAQGILLATVAGLLAWGGLIWLVALLLR